MTRPTTSRCRNPGLDLLVLGSGGPELNDQRAGSGYLLRENGRAHVLIDFGPGTSIGFERSRAQIADLKAVLFTHLHVDHTNDLPALVKASFFSNRTRDLPIYGPSGNDMVPDTAHFLQRLFGPQGAWSYLSDFLDGTARFALRPNVVDATLPTAESPQRHRPTFVTTQDGYTLQAVPIFHGLMPSLAWRIEKDGCSVVISGDTSNPGRTLDPLVADADLFVAPNAIPEDSTDAIARRLHMPPSEIGRIAAQSRPQAVLLSHFMQRTRLNQAATRAVVARQYPGPIHLARDGDAYRLQDGKRITAPAAKPAP